jgi:polysaccharide biosynthesis protein PslG
MMRRRGALAAAIAAAASLCAVVGAAPAAATPPPPFAEFYGISPATKLDGAETDRIGASGAGTLRLPFYWPSIEPDPPEADAGPLPPLPLEPPESKRWEATDDQVGDAARAGLRVLPFVYGTPDWVASDPARPPLDGEEARAAWRDLLDDLVRRYGPAGEFWVAHPGIPRTPITAWQIANEPNSELFWKPAPNPSEYADLLQISSAAIKAADPGAAIVLGGMFGTPASGIAAWEFLADLYAIPGTAEAFDAYALHPYAPNLNGIGAQVGLARKVVKANGDRRLPLLITEIGWPTAGPEGYNMVKSAQAQKRLLMQSFRLFLEQRRSWKLERVIWYTWRDNEVQPNCAVCRYSGLFTSDLQPKPAWGKFARFAGGHP